MTKNRIRTSLTNVIFLFVPMLAFGQAGSVKVFSEISGINVYLDDELKGIDVSNIDAVPAGSHYLKVTKQEVIIYGELITVRENEVTTILIKDSKEIQEKLLTTKFEEQEKYRAQKLDVMLSTKYVTETSGTTATNGGAVNVFPGYYALSSKSESTSISTTFAVTDWFLVRGTTRISELEFARITNNTEIINTYENVKLEKEKANLKKAKKSRAAMVITGAVMGAVGAFAILKGKDFTNPDARIVMLIIGSTLAVGGTAMVITGIVTATDKYNVYPGVGDLGLLKFDDAVKQSKMYNQNLKKELGLPENFEPK